MFNILTVSLSIILNIVTGIHDSAPQTSFPCLHLFVGETQIHFINSLWSSVYEEACAGLLVLRVPYVQVLHSRFTFYVSLKANVKK